MSTFADIYNKIEGDVTFGVFLKTLRKTDNISKEDFATLLNIPIEQLDQLEDDAVVIDLDFADKVAIDLGMNQSAFILMAKAVNKKITEKKDCNDVDSKLREIYQLYWENTQSKLGIKFHTSVKDLGKQYGIPYLKFPTLFRKANLSYPIGHCEYCDKNFVAYSRSEYLEVYSSASKLLPCKHTGTCKECTLPVTYHNTKCDHCRAKLVADLNKDKNKSNKSIPQTDESTSHFIGNFALTNLELKAGEIIHRQQESFKIDDLCKELNLSAGDANNILTSLIGKSALKFNYVGAENRFVIAGVSNELLDIINKLAKKIIHVVRNGLTFVIWNKWIDLTQEFRNLGSVIFLPQMCLVSFIDFENIKLDLDERGTDLMFKLKVDILITDGSTKPVHAILIKPDGSSKKMMRNFEYKKYALQLSGLPFDVICDEEDISTVLMRVKGNVEAS